MDKRKLAKRIFGRKEDLLHKIGHAVAFERMLYTVDISGPVFPERYVERRSIHEFVSSSIIGQEPVDYLEFGVFEGESIKWWTSLNGDPGSRFFGFDTFSGLPEDWDEKRAGHFDVGGALPDIKDDRVQFIPGLFQDTLRTFMADFQVKNRVILHMDADLYSSTLFCLALLDRIIDQGTVIIFDEFSSLNHEFAAFHDYCRSFNREFEIVCRTEGCEHIAFVAK